MYSLSLYSFRWRIGAKIALGDIQLSEVLLNKLMPHLQLLPILRSKMRVIMRRINRYCIFHFVLFILEIDFFLFHISVVIFSPKTSLISDISIYNFCLRLLIHPPTSIRTGKNVL